MASIPHGTVILAQGVAQVLQGGPQNIPNNNILPFFFGSPAPANGHFDSVAQTFTELTCPSRPSSPPRGSRGDAEHRQEPQQRAAEGTPFLPSGHDHEEQDVPARGDHHSIIKAGGGTANTAFLTSSSNPPRGNAQATQMQATFWIETIAGTGGQPDKLQLQYTQLVMLDFNGIHWPHVTVGTLVKQ